MDLAAMSANQDRIDPVGPNRGFGASITTWAILFYVGLAVVLEGAREGHMIGSWSKHMIVGCAILAVLAVGACALHREARLARRPLRAVGGPMTATRGAHPGLGGPLASYATRTWPLWALMIGVTAIFHWDCVAQLVH